MASLLPPFANDANKVQVIDTIVLRWQDIEIGLRPIIGQRGVVALYKRSLQLTSNTYPWLIHAHQGMNFAILKSAFEQQSKIDIIAAGEALLHTFCELLTTLVGSSLTERLLRSIWTNTPIDSPAQETSDE